MKKLVVLIFIISNYQSQSQDEISQDLSKFLTKNQIRFETNKKITVPKCIQINATVSTLGGELKSNILILDKIGYVSEVESPSGVHKTTINSSGMMYHDANTNSSELFETNSAKYNIEKRKMYLQSPLYSYNPKKEALSYKGIELDQNNVSCFVIEVISREKKDYKITYFINTEGQVTQEQIIPLNGASFEARNFYYEYKKTQEDYDYPSQIRMDDTEMTTITINSVTSTPNYKTELFDLKP